MDTYSVTQVFGVCALIAVSAVVAAVAVAVAARWSSVAAAMCRRVVVVAPAAATVVAAVMTAGSLYLSEVAGFIPCDLCWYQRICAYPLVVLGVVGLIRRDRGSWSYMVPLAAVGFVVAAYHHTIQAWPDLSAGTCSPVSPCTARHVWLWGFMSIPAMAAAGFAAVLAAALICRTGRTLPIADVAGPSES